MLIGICGDVHLNSNIRCRKDDFLTTALGKLDYIAQRNDKVIILGDVFHTCTNTDYLFNQVYTTFAKHKGKFITIVGNHDVFHHNLSRLNSTTLGNLSTTGVLDIKLSTFELGGITFDISQVMKDRNKLTVDKTNTKVLLGHNYFEFMTSPEESYSKGEIRELNYKYVFLGHDHKPYEDEFIGNSMLIRMGSLTRIDSQEYNKDRNLQYCRLDTDTTEVIKLPIPTISSEECYLPNSFGKTRDTNKLLNFVGLGALLEKFELQENSNSHGLLDSVLRSMGASDKQIEYIKEIHRDSNIRYN